NVTLTVKDDDGATNSTTKEIIILTYQYKLTTYVNPSKAGSIYPPDGTYEYGTVVKITAYANAGYSFDHWSGDANGTNSSINIIMNSNKNITANFVALHPPSNPINLQATAGDGYINLNWQAPENNGGAKITKYKIYRGTVSDGEIYLDDSSSLTYHDASVTNGITYYYYVTAINSAGESNHSNEVHAMPYEMPVPPPTNQPPSIEITYPLNNAIVSGTIAIKGISNDDKQVVKVEIKIDKGTWMQATGTNSWSYKWDTKNVSNGNHIIKARSYDGSLYSNVAFISINIFNNHKPCILIVNPVNGSVVNGSIKIMGVAWDEDGNDTITKVEIRIDNNAWHVANGTNSWNYSIDTRELKNGKHVVESRSYDGSLYSNVASIDMDVENINNEEHVNLLLIVVIVIIAILIIAGVLIKRKFI
ncbi:MAG: fibronectin type III domain-containing protein, partial [Thermoplasmata archaeon]|nr:fibronectin type III domain-containing protein [Thermoplasmata archaeon]